MERRSCWKAEQGHCPNGKISQGYECLAGRQSLFQKSEIVVNDENERENII